MQRAELHDPRHRASPTRCEGESCCGSHYQAINFRNPPLRSGQPDFCPGSYCFQIWVLKSSVRGFIFFQNQKILSRGLIFFLNFHTLFAVFNRFQCIWRQKRSKKFRLRRAGSYCFSKFSASGGVLFFSKIHKKNRLPGFYFFWEFSKSPIRGFKEGGLIVNSLVSQVDSVGSKDPGNERISTSRCV